MVGEATVGDIGTAGDIDALRTVAGDTGSKGQIVYFEPVDRDIEPGEYGIVFFAWQEFRSARESSPASGEAVDDMLANVKFVQIPSYHAGWTFANGRGENPG